MEVDAVSARAEPLARWELTPTDVEGYQKAEVTAGGADTRELSSQTIAQLRLVTLENGTAVYFPRRCSTSESS